MTLLEWKEVKGVTYTELSVLLNVDSSTLHRICKKGLCAKLHVAQKIVKATKGEVDFCDLLQGDC